MDHAPSTKLNLPGRRSYKMEILGLLCFVLSGFISVLSMMTIKYVNIKFGILVSDMIFCRSVFLFALVLPFAIWNKFSFLNKNTFKYNLFRDLLATIAIIIWYTYGSKVATNDVVLMSFLTPIMVLIGVRLFFASEGGPIGIWLAAILCFIGTMIAIEPSFSRFNGYYVMIFVAAIFRAAVNIVTKFTVAKQGIWQSFVTTAIFTFPITTVLSFPTFINFSMAAMPYILLISINYVMYLICFNLALYYGNISFMQPFDFNRFLLSVVLSYVFFGEGLLRHTIAGFCLIVCGYIFAVIAQKYKI